VWTDHYGEDEPTTTSSIPYQASEYVAALDRPGAETTPEWTRTLLQYNRLWRKLSAASYGNGANARFEYDGLGRSVLTMNNFGYRAETVYKWTTSAGSGWELEQRVAPPAGCEGLATESVYAQHSSETGEATSIIYYDRIGRGIRTIAHAADGTALIDLVYNALGQLVARSDPYTPQSEKVIWTIQVYDGYGRVASEHKVETPGRAIEPKSAADYLLRADVNTAKEDIDGAISAYVGMLELAPDNSAGWLALGRLRWRREDKDGALQDASRAIQLAPGFAEALGFRGFCHLERGELTQAEQDLSSAIELDPHRTSAWTLRGDVKFERKEFAAAEADFTRAIELDPKNDYHWYKRGRAKLRRRDFEPAIADFDEVLRLDPKSEMAHYRRAQAKLGKGELGPAIDDFTRAIEIDAKDFTNFSARAKARTVAGDFTGALADLDQAVVLAGEEVPYLQFSCFLLRLRLGLPGMPEALETVRTNTKNDWDQTLANFLLGNLDEATLLDRARAPGSSEENEHLCEAHYYAGMLRLLRADEAGARELFQRCLTAKTESPYEQDLAKAELVRLGSSP
jgi:tetratricopeptide (TPR) repeat protein